MGGAILTSASALLPCCALACIDSRLEESQWCLEVSHDSSPWRQLLSELMRALRQVVVRVRPCRPGGISVEAHVHVHMYTTCACTCTRVHVRVHVCVDDSWS